MFSTCLSMKTLCLPDATTIWPTTSSALIYALEKRFSNCVSRQPRALQQTHRGTTEYFMSSGQAVIVDISQMPHELLAQGSFSIRLHDVPFDGHIFASWVFQGCCNKKSDYYLKIKVEQKIRCCPIGLQGLKTFVFLTSAHTSLESKYSYLRMNQNIFSFNLPFQNLQNC